MRDPSERERTKRLGVLGGTFDPVHRGHIAIALAARDQLRLDRVLLVPARVPPHKPGVTAAGEDRLEMARLAARVHPGLEACSIELDREGVSYTVDTLAELRRRHPDAELYFIIGADSVPELPGWRRYADVFGLARVVTLPRPGAPGRFDPELFPDVPRHVLEDCERRRLEVDPVPVASREIREAIAEGRPFEDDVPPQVADYIKRKRLYGCGGRPAPGKEEREECPR